MKKFYVYLIN